MFKQFQTHLSRCDIRTMCQFIHPGHLHHCVIQMCQCQRAWARILACCSQTLPRLSPWVPHNAAPRYADCSRKYRSPSQGQWYTVGPFDLSCRLPGRTALTGTAELRAASNTKGDPLECPPLFCPARGGMRSACASAGPEGPHHPWMGRTANVASVFAPRRVRCIWWRLRGKCSFLRWACQRVQSLVFLSLAQVALFWPLVDPIGVAPLHRPWPHGKDRPVPVHPLCPGASPSGAHRCALGPVAARHAPPPRCRLPTARHREQRTRVRTARTLGRASPASPPAAPTPPLVAASVCCDSAPHPETQTIRSTWNQEHWKDLHFPVWLPKCQKRDGKWSKKKTSVERWFIVSDNLEYPPCILCCCWSKDVCNSRTKFPVIFLPQNSAVGCFPWWRQGVGVVLQWIRNSALCAQGGGWKNVSAQVQVFNAHR